jgi:hypothetical protein
VTSRRVALCGNPGSGKTSIAQAWADKVEGVRLSFATGVKLEAAYAIAAADSIGAPDRIDFVAARHLAAMQDPNTKDQYRRIQQLWGTEFRRAVDPEYWVRVLELAIEQYGRDIPIVVDDCRFVNEYNMLKGEQFTFVVLDDGDTTREMTPEQQAHESEAYWRSFSFDFNLPYRLGPEEQAGILQELLEGLA